MFLLVSLYNFQVASDILLGIGQHMGMILTTHKFFVKKMIQSFLSYVQHLAWKQLDFWRNSDSRDVCLQENLVRGQHQKKFKKANTIAILLNLMPTRLISHL